MVGMGVGIKAVDFCVCSEILLILRWISSVLPSLYSCNCSYKNEPPHDKTNKMACASSKDSDQPGHLHSLIRVFAVRMKKAWVLSYPLSAQRRLIRLGGCPGCSASSLGAQSFCWVCQVAQMVQLTHEKWGKRVGPVWDMLTKIHIISKNVLKNGNVIERSRGNLIFIFCRIPV